jgi:hypothetical protein
VATVTSCIKTPSTEGPLQKIPLSEKNSQKVGFALLKGTNSCMEVSDVAELLQRLVFREDYLLKQVSVVGSDHGEATVSI